MTSLERIARMLAAELSANGEEDWQSYLALARQISTRMDDEFSRIFERPEVEG